MAINRGDIYLAALDPVMGREVAKTHPVVVVSNDIGNQYSGTVTVLPITSQNLQRIFPFEYLLPKGCGNLTKRSKVKADQIRTLDKTRLVKHIGRIRQKDLLSISEAIKIHLDLQ